MLATRIIAAAQKRSHHLTLIPNNAETILKERHVIVFCNQSGETLRAAPTQLITS